MELFCQWFVFPLCNPQIIGYSKWNIPIRAKNRELWLRVNFVKFFQRKSKANSVSEIAVIRYESSVTRFECLQYVEFRNP